MTIAPSVPVSAWVGRAPGLALSLAVAIAAVLSSPWLKAATGGAVALPDMVLALLIGIVLNALATQARFEPGLTFAVKTLLRWAIGLLGLRIALGDILALGAPVALLVIASMAATLAFAIWGARRLGLDEGYGALAGAANAVCGASATLATATAVPDYPRKSADIAFTVVMANAISTVVMLAYPALALWLGLGEHQSAILLGATIQDMAQVVGAGYALSEPVGNQAVIVKLFRVLLLLPVVLAVGLWFARARSMAGQVPSVPVPVFALVFLALCGVNSVMVASPDLAAQVAYPLIKGWLSEAARWGMLVAIAALGLGTSLRALFSIGWRHVGLFLATALFILVVVLAALALVA